MSRPSGPPLTVRTPVSPLPAHRIARRLKTFLQGLASHEAPHGRLPVVQPTLPAPTLGHQHQGASCTSTPIGPRQVSQERDQIGQASPVRAEQGMGRGTRGTPRWRHTPPYNTHASMSPAGLPPAKVPLMGCPSSLTLITEGTQSSRGHALEVMSHGCHYPHPEPAQSSWRSVHSN